MTTKTCFKCKKVKELFEFYRHPRMGDGYLNKCKNCAKKDAKNRTNKLRFNNLWLESERKRSRDKYYRLEYRGKFYSKKTLEASKKWISKFPEKRKAQAKSQRMICDVGFQKHHWSYIKDHWTDIIPLNISDHAKIHRYTVYDQERKQYRNLSGVLLDTKDAYMKYLEMVLNLND